jgi:uracil-DNA glycosylase
MKPIVFVGEALGESEVRLGGLPLVGPSGAELLRMLGEAKVIDLTVTDREYLRKYYSENNPAHIDAIWQCHPEVYRTNVFQIPLPKNDIENLCGPKAEGIPGYPALLKSKYVRAEYEHELDRLASELIALDPNVVVVLGNTPLWALAGQTGISKVRGTTLPSTKTVLDFKLLPTFHPANVIRDWSQRPVVIADFIKAARESAFPEIRRPPREIWIEPTYEDIITFRDTYIRGCDLLSTDIETSGQRITCIGFAPSADRAIVIPFDDERSKSGCYWPTWEDEYRVWTVVRGILEDQTVPKLFQNGAYDIAFLWRAYGIPTMGAAEDTMLLSHALQPELKKGLGFLGSIYSDEGSWKHMRKKTETIKRDN